MELVLLTILKTHQNKLSVNRDIDQVMKDFVRDAPNPMVTDEYQIADKIIQLIKDDTQNGSEPVDWQTLMGILKKPIFNFLNNEVVKQTKLALIDMEENQEL